jgi:hypothetical protein
MKLAFSGMQFAGFGLLFAFYFGELVRFLILKGQQSATEDNYKRV